MAIGDAASSLTLFTLSWGSVALPQGASVLPPGGRVGSTKCCPVLRRLPVARAGCRHCAVDSV